MAVNRRNFVKSALLLPGFTLTASSLLAVTESKVWQPAPFKRVRPGDPAWPSAENWEQLNSAVNGNLIKLESPWTACKTSPDSDTCKQVFRNLKNPYDIGDDPALTQSSGWLDAWQSQPSAYAVAARTTADVVAAVNFARLHHLRIVVKGGGHSYQGTSNSADSLLVWTRHMHAITMHESFVAEGCGGKAAAQPAVTIEAGAMWLQAYDAVTVKGGRYVQGGGCTTVGVAGLIQGGGFGSFSKHYGLAAAALLEAEIVTADGSVKIANGCQHPDLFWALKGGGGGSFGVVTKLTVRTRELPENFGVVFGNVKASSDKAYITLIEKFISFYKEKLFNPHWGEQIRFRPDNVISLTMLSHGLTREEASVIWQPFEDWIKQSPEDYSFEMPITVVAIPARRLWDAAFLKEHAPTLIATDDRPGAADGNVYWASNKEEAGQFLYGYRSAWMPASLIEKNKQKELAAALFAASRYWSASLHFNKGLAGAPAEEIAAAKDTAMNPDVLDAFALMIIAGEGEPAYAGVKGYEPDTTEGRREADRINKAMDEILKVAPGAGSYLSESNYFEKDWKQSFWGAHHKKLAEVKKQHDPEGLFFVHHGIGSEDWSDDGFTRLV